MKNDKFVVKVVFKLLELVSRKKPVNKSPSCRCRVVETVHPTLLRPLPCLKSHLHFFVLILVRSLIPHRGCKEDVLSHLFAQTPFDCVERRRVEETSIICTSNGMEI